MTSSNPPARADTSPTGTGPPISPLSTTPTVPAGAEPLLHRGGVRGKEEAGRPRAGVEVGGELVQPHAGGQDVGRSSGQKSALPGCRLTERGGRRREPHRASKGP